jgi:hypothetical protein
VVIDPSQRLADLNERNNIWPQETEEIVEPEKSKKKK